MDPQSAPQGPGGSLKEQIVYMEAQTWEALKSNGEALIPYLAPDCVMIFPGATIFDRESEPTLEEILRRPDMKPWARYQMDDVRVVELSTDAAMICYHVDATRQQQGYEALITSVWRKSEGSWKMVLHQQTPATTV